MKIWIGKDNALQYWKRHPAPAKRMAIYAFWQGDKFRRKPEFRLHKDRAPNYGLDGKRCGLFMAWLGLVVHIAPLDLIARLDRWPFRTLPTCGYSQHSGGGGTSY